MLHIIPLSRYFSLWSVIFAATSRDGQFFRNGLPAEEAQLSASPVDVFRFLSVNGITTSGTSYRSAAVQQPATRRLLLTQSDDHGSISSSSSSSIPLSSLRQEEEESEANRRTLQDAPAVGSSGSSCKQSRRTQDVGALWVAKALRAVSNLKFFSDLCTF
jgi:hypothetical protein